MTFSRRWVAMLLTALTLTCHGAAQPVLNVADWPGQVVYPHGSRVQEAIVGYPFVYTLFPGDGTVTVTGLPPGLALDGNKISGQPTQAGTYAITISVTAPSGTASADVSLTVLPYPTTPPVFPPNMELHAALVGPGVPVEGWSYSYFVIPTTNGATAWTMEGIDPASWDMQHGVVQYDNNALTPGIFFRRVTATNVAGTAESTVKWIVHPAVRNIELGAPRYAPGDKIVLFFTFNAPVFVTGAPTVSLNGGALQAQYVAGSGTDRLTFECQTTPASASFSEYCYYNIALNGGTIATADGATAKGSDQGEAVLVTYRFQQMPQLILGVPAAAAPRATAILKPAAGAYRPGNRLTFGIRFSADGIISYSPAALEGRPRLQVTVGSNIRYAPLTWHALYGSSEIVAFEYVLTEQDGPTSSVSIGSTLDFNGGTLTKGGVPVDPNLATPEVQAAGGLGLTGVTVGAYPAGALYPCTVTGCAVGGYSFVFHPAPSAPIAPYSVDSVPPGLTITAGPFLRIGVRSDSGAPYGHGSGTITLRGGSASASVKLVAVPSNSSEYLPDGNEVGSVITPADGTYRVGDVLRFGVSYGPVVSVTGTPRLSFAIGGQPREATYVPGASASNVMFEYVVTASDRGALTLPPSFGGDCYVQQLGMPGATQKRGWMFDVDTSGIQVGEVPDSTSIQVQSAELRPVVGTPFSYQIVATGVDAGTATYDVLSLPPGLVVDHQTGLISGTTWAEQRYDARILVTDRSGRASASLTIFPGRLPRIADTVDVYYHVDQVEVPVRLGDGSAGVTWAPASVVSATGELLVDRRQPGISTVRVTATNAWGAVTKDVEVRVHPAVIGVSTSSGVLRIGDAFRITFRLNRAVTVTGQPRAMIHFSDQSYAFPDYESGSGTDTLVFVYRITANDPAGSVRVTSGVGGELIRDGDGLMLEPYLPEGIITGQATVDPTQVTDQPGPPVLTMRTPLDLYYKADDPDANKVQLTATGNPTWGPAHLITLTGIVSYPWDYPTGTVWQVTATNQHGTSNINVQATIHAAVIRVQESSGVHRAGATYRLTLTCNRPIIVTGRPAVPLQVADGSKRQAWYESGGGSSELVFAYTVAADDPAGKISPAPAATVDPAGAQLRSDNGFQLGPYLPLKAFVPSATIEWPPEPKTTPTISFSSPVSAVAIGVPIQLGATSSAGLAISYAVVSGNATLSGTTLTPNSTETLIVRASTGETAQYNAASVDVNFGNPLKAAQTISVMTTGGKVAAEQPVTLSGTSSSGLPLAYTVIGGPATVSGNTLTFTGTGTVTVRASQAGDGMYAAADDVMLTFTATPVNRLVNLSSRLRATAGDASNGGIAGFVVTGTAPKPILIRAVGPTLAQYGIGTPLAEPQLRIFKGDAVIASNDGWNSDAQIAAAGDAVGAFKLSAGSRDAAVLMTVEPGIYTAQVSSDGAGTVLVEVYDVSAMAAVPTKQLINISTRAQVGTSDNALIAGFVVAGDSPKRVLIRAVGPGLTAYGVGGVLADPMLKLHDVQGTVLARNDNWHTQQRGDIVTPEGDGATVAAAAASTGAFGLYSGSADAAMVVSLNPGNYTVIVEGVNGGTGAALVEVYELGD